MRVVAIFCASCGAPVDPLRAGAVAILEGQFRYFCDDTCRRRELIESGLRAPIGLSVHNALELVMNRDTPSPVSAAISQTATQRRTPEPEPISSPTPTRAVVAPRETEATPRSPEDNAGDADTLLLATAGAAGLLTVALTLMGAAPVVTGARAAVAVVGALALAARTLTVARDPSDAHPVVILAAPIVSSMVAVIARARGDAGAGEATSVAGVILLVSALLAALRTRALADAEAERRWIASALSLPGRRITRDDVTVVAAHELRTGEAIRVERGEIVPADMTISRGQASVLPWLGATSTVMKREGDPLVAGSRLVEGVVEGIAGFTGRDRAWARLVLDPDRRVDVRSAVCRASRFAATQGALTAGALAALATFANSGHIVEVLVAAVASYAAIGTTTVASVAGLHVLRGALAAARRGISYRPPDAWDAAARVTSAVFLARGTLLLGEPDVVEIEPSAHHSADQILAWVAGAEAGQGNPIAAAISRAARHRSTTADAVRSPHIVPGLGVKAVTSAGEPLCVGSRALMLEERTSIALAEGRVAELEGLGRTVLLVAVSGRLAGLVALQDGLRPGARASVQHLLDVEIEPVLLSGDARETCETIARALDIDHIRPEVLPSDRAAEVRRIAEGGAKVAVIGRPGQDDDVLDAADVAIALGSAGASKTEWAIALASDDVRDAALSLSLAHRSTIEAKTSTILAFAPGLVGALAVSFGLLPPVFAPLAGFVGGAVSLLYARSTGGARREVPLTPWDLVVPR